MLSKGYAKKVKNTVYFDSNSTAKGTVVAELAHCPKIQVS